MIVFLGLVMMVAAYADGFSNDSRLYGLTLNGTIGGNAFKIVFLI